MTTTPPPAFPAGFRFGTATAATQIEGGCDNTDWAAFAEAGKTQNGDSPVTACAHWERWREDLALMGELSMNAYRMSVEWARIEPEEGRFDAAALDRYRDEVGALVDAGIAPMVTLHHFSLPRWLTPAGGLLARELPALMARMTTKVADVLGDLVPEWVTVNEPNVVTTVGYLFGQFPPGKIGRVDEMMRAHHNLLAAHVAMYRALKTHQKARDARVGVAHHLRVFEAERPERRRDRAATRVAEAMFNDGFVGALFDGQIAPGLDEVMARVTGFHAKEARGTQDFVGLNYYSRDRVKASLDPREGFLERVVPDGAEVSDLGWEVYPAGLGQLLDALARRSTLPIVITENGIADATDTQRPSFLVRHLAEVARAIARGVPVTGYMHWSLIDNFEWHEGYAPRFGLVDIDYATKARTPRPSAALYASIARAGVIDEATWAAHKDPPKKARRFAA